MFEILIQEMKLRNFSSKTIDVYLYYNKEFLQFCQKSPRDISHKDIRIYLLHLITRQYSSSTINLAHNALNFYYGKILQKSVDRISFQKKEQRIKQIASVDEIQRMHFALKNPKHKLILSLLYATGVRVSELVCIKIKDIDLERKLLCVRQGKGKKDRYTILSNAVIDEMKNYLRTRPDKSPYLFASSGGHISPRTVEEVITQACTEAQIQKKITPHSLRHSFATHHMEAGTKTEYIQQMLGHTDIRTTRGYEQIVTSHLEKIKSPHDNFII
ncbi:MAG: tyrosine-type recombinase/integrase [Nanoarchaeota archaeon]|nr:tyrosine-type recombinase/integrase [Nanoarchaeota archaeon]